MGYCIGKSTKGWRLLHREYVKDPKSGKYRARWRHVKKSEYPAGIKPDMSRDEVGAAIKKLNADAELTRRENARNRIAKRLDNEELVQCAHLPAPQVEQFETDHLPTRYLGNDARLTKILKLWAAAKRLVRTLTRPNDQWWKYPEPIYAYFTKHQMSPGYAKNILSTLNMWLEFQGIRPVPAPGSGWLARMNTAFEESGNSKASLPITPKMLESADPKFTLAQYNWLYCSVWAGLRPNEVDALTNPKRTRIRYQDKTPILCIYQSKLKNVPKTEDRWKYIPLFLPEMARILEIIDSKELKAPLSKTVASRWPGCSLYGGRKGFHELMVTRYEQPELEVVRWLGHRSLDMAMKHYVKKDTVRWKKAA